MIPRIHKLRVLRNRPGSIVELEAVATGISMPRVDPIYYPLLDFNHLNKQTAFLTYVCVKFPPVEGF